MATEKGKEKATETATPNQRKKNMFMARLASKAERYDEMIEFMEKVTAAAKAEGEELTVKERSHLSEAYRQAILFRRTSKRVLSYIERKEVNPGNEEYVVGIRCYRAKIESEISSICDAVLRLVGDQLVPSASTAESRVFYLKMKGDYHRYLAEIKTDTDREEAAESALSAYTSAKDIALAGLGPAHPTTLSLLLNLSVFYVEIMHSPEQALEIANKAFDDGFEAVDSVADGLFEDSLIALYLLEDNLKLWRSFMKGDDKDEIETKSHDDKNT